MHRANDREPLRVLRILTRPNLGGPARQCLALASALPGLDVQELLLTGACRASETELEFDLPTLDHLDCERMGTKAAGLVRLPELVADVDLAADLRAFTGLLRILRSFRPMILHTHTAKAGFLGALASRFVPLQLVHSYHGHVLKDYFSPLRTAGLLRIERFLSRARSWQTCVSRTCADELLQLRVLQEGEFDVIPPAVDCRVFTEPVDRVQLRRELSLPEDAFCIGYAGRLVDVKDPLLLVSTLRELCGMWKDKRELIACCFGTGPLEAKMRAAADGLPLRMMGARGDFPRLLPAMDLLLMTSKREGLPLAALEALMSGVPVVGPTVPGLLDLAGDGMRLVATREPKPLAMACLVPDEVSKARQDALMREHDVKVVANLYVEMYRKLLA